MTRINYSFILFLSILFLPEFTHAQEKRNTDLKLWYTKPAADWNNALPVGNGRLGAMVFGEVENERIQLNEESVWLGSKGDFYNPLSYQGLKEVRKLLFEGKYSEAEQVAQQKLMGNKQNPSSYQTLGDLHLTFQNLKNITRYQRSLDLENALAEVSFKSDGILYKREIFSSAPDQVIVIRLSVEEGSLLNFTATLSRPGNTALTTSSKDEIRMTENVGNGNGVFLYSRLKIVLEGGSIVKKGLSLKIKNAKAVTLFLSAATNYQGNAPGGVTKKQIANAISRSYEQLKQDHIKEYHNYFKRVDFDLQAEAVNLPTNERLQNIKDGLTDHQLIELYYQFGRYLLISSSRPGCMPSNLQGIWADGTSPPWDADYHININIQMNYWPAEISNLSEMHMPFLQFIDQLREDGRNTAKNMYGVEGVVAHFTTDAWHYTEPHGKTDWAMWPMGYAWSSMHFWEHYLFTEDKAYLKTLAYPAMKDAAVFCKNWLIKNPKTGKLVSGPSISPENKFIAPDGKVASIVMGPTMDHMIIHDLLKATIQAGEILKADSAFLVELKKILTELSPVKVGSDGRLMEWTEEFKEQDPGHRHISHLYGLHPGNQINRSTPELLEAAKKTIHHRLSHGGGHTGWSRAWIINFFARLEDGEASYTNLLALLKKSTLDNLFDNHPPFQIDGNFGATAGITEMLMQSHAGEIHLLPALPKAWANGHIHGIVARGGFEVSMDWENGHLKKVTLLSRLGNDCKIRLGEKTIELKTEKGQLYSFDGELK